MLDVDWLNKCCDRVVELRFSNGHVVLARLFLVNPDNDEIIYDVLKVVHVGPSKLAKLRPGAGLASAKLSDLEDFSLSHEASSSEPQIDE
jgi:hypothetical protein